VAVAVKKEEAAPVVEKNEGVVEPTVDEETDFDIPTFLRKKR